MSIERFHPLQELEAMKREMDRIWHDVFFPPGPEVDLTKKKTEREQGVATPAIDIIDRDDSVLIKAEMPGVKKEDLSVSVEKDILTVRGTLKEETGKETDRYTYSERRYSSFSRSLSLPANVKHEDIKATLKDGILHITLPKVVEEQPRKIKIDVS